MVQSDRQILHLSPEILARILLPVIVPPPDALQKTTDPSLQRPLLDDSRTIEGQARVILPHGIGRFIKQQTAGILRILAGSLDKPEYYPPVRMLTNPLVVEDGELNPPNVSLWEQKSKIRATARQEEEVSGINFQPEIKPFVTNSIPHPQSIFTHIKDRPDQTSKLRQKRLKEKVYTTTERQNLVVVKPAFSPTPVAVPDNYPIPKMTPVFPASKSLPFPSPRETKIDLGVKPSSQLFSPSFLSSQLPALSPEALPLQSLPVQKDLPVSAYVATAYPMPLVDQIMISRENIELFRMTTRVQNSHDRSSQLYGPDDVLQNYALKPFSGPIEGFFNLLRGLAGERYSFQRNCIQHNYEQCLHPSTMVVTKTALLPISQLQEGMETLADDGNYYPIIKVTRGPKKAYILTVIETKDLGQTILTKDHPVLTLNKKAQEEWLPTGKLKKTTILLIPLTENNNHLSKIYPTYKAKYLQMPITRIVKKNYTGSVYNLIIKGSGNFVSLNATLKSLSV